MIRIQCVCGQQLDVESGYSGAIVECPKCNTQLKIEDQSQDSIQPSGFDTQTSNPSPYRLGPKKKSTGIVLLLGISVVVLLGAVVTTWLLTKQNNRQADAEEKKSVQTVAGNAFPQPHFNRTESDPDLPNKTKTNPAQNNLNQSNLTADRQGSQLPSGRIDDSRTNKTEPIPNKSQNQSVRKENVQSPTSENSVVAKTKEPARQPPISDTQLAKLNRLRDETTPGEKLTVKSRESDSAKRRKRMISRLNDDFEEALEHWESDPAGKYGWSPRYDNRQFGTHLMPADFEIGSYLDLDKVFADIESTPVEQLPEELDAIRRKKPKSLRLLRWPTNEISKVFWASQEEHDTTRSPIIFIKTKENASTKWLEKLPVSIYSESTGRDLLEVGNQFLLLKVSDTGFLVGRYRELSKSFGLVDSPRRHPVFDFINLNDYKGGQLQGSQVTVLNGLTVKGVGIQGFLTDQSIIRFIGADKVSVDAVHKQNRQIRRDSIERLLNGPSNWRLRMQITRESESTTCSITSPSLNFAPLFVLNRLCENFGKSENDSSSEMTEVAKLLKQFENYQFEPRNRDDLIDDLAKTKHPDAKKLIIATTSSKELLGKILLHMISSWDADEFLYAEKVTSTYDLLDSAIEQPKISFAPIIFNLKTSSRPELAIAACKYLAELQIDSAIPLLRNVVSDRSYPAEVIEQAWQSIKAIESNSSIDLTLRIADDEETAKKWLRSMNRSDRGGSLEWFLKNGISSNDERGDIVDQIIRLLDDSVLADRAFAVLSKSMKADESSKLLAIVNQSNQDGFRLRNDSSMLLLYQLLGQFASDEQLLNLAKSPVEELHQLAIAEALKRDVSGLSAAMVLFPSEIVEPPKKSKEIKLWSQLNDQPFLALQHFELTQETKKYLRERFIQFYSTGGTGTEAYSLLLKCDPYQPVMATTLAKAAMTSRSLSYDVRRFLRRYPEDVESAVWESVEKGGNAIVGCKILFEIGTVESLEQLRTLLNDDNTRVQELAAEAIKMIEKSE